MKPAEEGSWIEATTNVCFGGLEFEEERASVGDELRARTANTIGLTAQAIREHGNTVALLRSQMAYAHQKQGHQDGV